MIPQKKRIDLENPHFMRLLLVLAALALTLFLYQFKTLQRFEYVTYDYRCRAASPVFFPKDSPIAVIEISDDSVAKIGRWPWDRDWHAMLVKVLTEAGARAIVFDVIFSEPSEESKDKLFSKSIELSKRVFLAEVVEFYARQEDSKLLTSLPMFGGVARGQGHINLFPDEDGVMRRIPMLIRAGDRNIPQLSLAVALELFGVSVSKLQVKPREVSFMLEKENISIPLDSHGNLIIRWNGIWKDVFEHYSYADVVGSYIQEKRGEKATVPLENFKDKICFVGTTASGLFDIRSTPLEPSYPAVGVNMTVLSNIIERKFILQASFLTDFFIFLLVSVFLYFATRAESYVRNVFYTLGLATAFIFVAVILFVGFGLWVSIVYPLVLIFSGYFSVTVYNQLAIAIERAKLLKLAIRDSLTGLYNIGHFKLLLKAEISTLAIHPDRVMSIVMCDVDNFKHTNDTYGHQMGDAVLRELGTIVKATCRALDVAARYGGEEFILMLPGATAQEAFKVAEKIRVALNQKVFFHEKEDFRTSISLGIAQAHPDEKDPELIIARADKALYEAKHTGKNKTVISKILPKK